MSRLKSKKKMTNYFILWCAGQRGLLSRRSVVTLTLGMIVGFSMAMMFVSSPTRSYWLPYNDHFHSGDDPHNGHALIDAVGPEMDVG